VNIIAVIPARMASTRCPGKPLVELAGKPMVQWVFEAAQRAEVPRCVVIATPDQEIVDAASGFGCEAVLTRSDHRTGTDRIAEVAEMLEADGYVNVQGDEPFIEASSIDACAMPIATGAAQMASVYDWLTEDDESDPNVVKVVTDNRDRALYFSRSMIPYLRGEKARGKKHVGLYAYSRDALLNFSKWPPTPLERSESLEQLRFLENGVGIQMTYAPGTPLAVDTPEQAKQASEMLARRSDL
jgi:3-deoxy-manno-octulosonate cytidylyltransferase (CMP-KDO synthetase)